MTFTKGVPRPPNAGRKRGSRNKRTMALAEVSEKAIQAGLTPLDFLLEILRDRAKDDRLRLDAAKAAAPYVHPKASDNSTTVVADPNKSSQQLREELAQYLTENGVPPEMVYAISGIQVNGDVPDVGRRA